MTITKKKIVVVGGSSGIGRAAAYDLALAGASVVITSRSVEKLLRAKAESPRAIEIDTVNIQHEQSVEELFRRIGAFDHLVISAATAVLGDFLKTDLARSRDFV